MSAPLNRAQRILHFIAGRKKPTSLQQIAKAVADPDAETTARFTTLVAAQLHQLTKNGKVKRAGKPMAYTYAASPRTLLDGRKFDREGKPRVRKAPPARKPRAPAPKPSAAREPKPARTVDRGRIVDPRPRIGPPRRTGERETVEEFEARGGRVQKLKPGESSRPMYETARDLSQASMRKRLTESADNDDTNDDELAVA